MEQSESLVVKNGNKKWRRQTEVKHVYASLGTSLDFFWKNLLSSIFREIVI